MTAYDLYVKLRDLGIGLTEEKGRLWVNAPPGRPELLTEELRAKIADEESALIAILDYELGWRTEAIAMQIPRSGPIPSGLVARSDVKAAEGMCGSCGEEPATPMSLPQGPRCNLCLRAVNSAVVAEEDRRRTARNRGEDT
jgi:hypothetical protein